MSSKIMMLEIATGQTVAMWPVDAKEAVALGQYLVAPLQPGQELAPLPARAEAPTGPPPVPPRPARAA